MESGIIILCVGLALGYLAWRSSSKRRCGGSPNRPKRVNLTIKGESSHR